MNSNSKLLHHRAFLWNITWFFLLLLIPGVGWGQPTSWKAFDEQVPIPRPRQWLTLKSQRTPFQLPYFSNISLDQKNSVGDTLYVPIHGGGRNAKKMVRLVEKILNQSSASTPSLIFAPYFLYEWNLSYAEKSRHGIYWKSGWNNGRASLSHSDVTSFNALNLALKKILSSHPEIKKIFFIGHSAGAQFLHRYMHFQKGFENIKAAYVIANPSSYFYLNASRTAPSSQLSQCPNYNHYKWGPEKIPTLLNQIVTDDLMANYQRQNITYVLARGDKKQDVFLAKSCEDFVQGKNRWERGQKYKRWLHKTFGTSITQKSHFLYLPKSIGHDNDAVLLHPEVRKIILHALDTPAKI